MKTPAVSILVPIYNVSNFIERCAHSLFGQTFDDIEYVFVDDCTPDDSIAKLQKVIEQYPNREPNVKIVHHEKNRGLAAARNTAIDNSTGKYIQHIDSDDWVEIDMIEQMYKKAEEEKADIVVCDALIERKNETIFFPSLFSTDRDDIFRDLMLGTICVALWNKLIRRELYEIPEHRVPEGLNYFEDSFVFFRLLFSVNKIIKVSKPLYHYNKTNTNALTGKVVQPIFENFVLFWEQSDIFLQGKGIYNKFVNEIEAAKVIDKAALLTSVVSYSLRKQYAYLYRDFEMKYLKTLTFKSEKLILFFTHYRMFGLAHLVQKLLQLKVKLFSK